MLARRATRADFPRVLQLLREFAAFERHSGPDEAVSARLLADLDHRFNAWVSESKEGAIVGYAIVFETYSTFLARPLLYIEDLYVAPAVRGSGAAQGLMRALANDAVQRGCGRLAWATHSWNAVARRFYAKLGAPETDLVTLVLEGDALHRLATAEGPVA